MVGAVVGRPRCSTLEGRYVEAIQLLRRAQSLEYRENVQRFLEDLELRAKR